MDISLVKTIAINFKKREIETIALWSIIQSAHYTIKCVLPEGHTMQYGTQNSFIGNSELRAQKFIF